MPAGEQFVLDNIGWHIPSSALLLFLNKLTINRAQGHFCYKTKKPLIV